MLTTSTDLHEVAVAVPIFFNAWHVADFARSFIVLPLLLLWLLASTRHGRHQDFAVC